MSDVLFEWDERENAANQRAHGVSFEEPQLAFLDPHRVIARDDQHSKSEERFFCIGKVNAGILTVRYTMRGEQIRVIGGGFWRKGHKAYEEANPLHE